MSDNTVCVRVCECREDTKTRSQKSFIERLRRKAPPKYIYTQQVEMNYTQHFLDPYQQKLQVQGCTRTVIMKKKGFTERKMRNTTLMKIILSINVASPPDEVGMNWRDKVATVLWLNFRKAALTI